MVRDRLIAKSVLLNGAGPEWVEPRVRQVRRLRHAALSCLLGQQKVGTSQQVCPGEAKFTSLNMQFIFKS